MLTLIMRMLLPLLFAVAAFAQSDPSGRWEGTLQEGRGPRRMTLDIAKNAKGAWAASLGVPERQITGLRVANLSVEGNRVRFTASDVPNNPTFDLTLAEGKLSGTLSVQGHSLPLEMTRTGDAKVEAPPASPAVSKELEGDWEGSITGGNVSRPVVVHFKNQPDGSVLATIDSPSQNGFGIPLAQVVEKDGAVEFAVRIHGGSYKGALKGTEIAGYWTQKPGDPQVQLNLKKK